MPSLKARLIAFYLPQFHTIPENDRWWGKGFTEWTNVRSAKALFPGHVQPRKPTELGYYDLSDPTVLERQANMAQKFGVEGFCFWHYWFNGKLVLEAPLEQMLQSKKPAMPFCLAWANETWSRRWDGRENEILLKQDYGGDKDDYDHFNWLLPFFHDQRAMRMHEKPIFLVYRPLDLPDPIRTTTLWRHEARRSGLKDLYLIGVQTSFDKHIDLRSMGFDTSLRFQPQFDNILYQTLQRDRRRRVLPIVRILQQFKKKYGRTRLSVYDYAFAAKMCKEGKSIDFPQYQSVFPQWDNTPRKKNRGLTLQNPDPVTYGDWLLEEIEAVEHLPYEERLVFINAWNEWAEGNYLEPDMLYGDQYLQETLNANINRGSLDI